MRQPFQKFNNEQQNGQVATITDFSSFDSGEAYGKIKQAEINFINEVAEVLKKNDLIEPENGFIADGSLHTCADKNKPRRQRGRYAIHKERPLSAEFWIKGQDCVQSYSAKPESSMTNNEHEIFFARIKRLEEQQKKEWDKGKQVNMRFARLLYGSYPEARDDNPFLRQKGISGFGLIKADPKTGNIVVPVYRGDNNSIVNIQYLSLTRTDNEKNERFLFKEKIYGHFFFPADKGHERDPILIAEDFATGASLYAATGYETWITFSPYNLAKVAIHIASKNQNSGRTAIICADYDPPSEKIQEEGGIGVYLAREAAELIGGCLAICPPVGLSGRGNFNNLLIARGIEAVAAEIHKSLDAGCLQQADPLPQNFEIKFNDLYYNQCFENGKKEQIYLCSKIKVLGKSRTDDSDAWGLYIEWKDDDHEMHSGILQKSSLAAYDRAQKVIGFLMDEGLNVTGNRGHWEYIYKFFLEYKTKRRVTSVNTLGWHHDSFVMPDKVYGLQNAEDIIVLDKKINKKLFQVAGSYEEWLQIPILCIGNTRLVFALCCAFAAVLLRPANLESGAFSLEGESSSGKTSALKIAASVFGCYESHINQWRATDNALEGIASIFSDNLLLIDELGQGDPRAVSQVSYMITSGQGKARMNRNADLRRTNVWRTLVLSSGEVGLADKLLEKGETVKAGQQVRFVGIPTSKKDIQDTHNLPNEAVMLKQLCEIALHNYGHAGRMFLESITVPETLVELKETLPKIIDDYVGEICPEKADGQVRRVAQRFALVAIAGDMAIQNEILPVEIDPFNAVKACFDCWLEARGGTESAEKIAILERMRLCLEKHGKDRFQSLEPPLDNDGNPRPSFIRDRIGFTDDDGKYYILPESFKQIMQGFNPKQAAKILYESGWIFKVEQGRFTKRKSLPELGQQHVYHIMMPEADD